MEQKNYIINLLNLQDKHIFLEKIEFINNTFFIYLIQVKEENSYCPFCGGTSLSINSYYKRFIKFQVINDYPSILIFKQNRFICNYCKKTFNQKTTLVDKGCSISNHIKKSILSESKLKQSFKDISKRTNVSQTTVSNEFKSSIHDYRCSLTRIICIDEFKASTIAGKYALIIGDPESGEILDILPSRIQEYIYHYFSTIPDSERFSVKYVVTDLFESYRTICKNLFWKSIHIADRFHWVKLTTQAFNKTRISIMNVHLKSKNKESITYANILKTNYKLFLANRYSKESWFFDQPAKKNNFGFTTYQTIIEYCINKDKELEEAYNLLQSLYCLSRYSSFETATKDIYDWCDKVNRSEFELSEFKKVALTYKSWIKEITNSFIIDPVTHKRLSNGFIEGKNNFCKTIKRIGFGYSDFDVFRYKIINSNKKKK